MINALEITNQYLYGSFEKPTKLDTDLLIRNNQATTQVDVDTLEYMTEGPGRFANPALFELIDKFFNPNGDASASLVAGAYNKNQLFSMLGIESGGLVLQQWLYDDGKDDMVERAYIWNTTQFQISSDSIFVIGADGVRSIENFSIVPRVNPAAPENFDFDSNEGVGKIANLALEPAIDPSGLGRKVILNFNGDDVPGKKFTLENYNDALASIVPRNELNVLKLVTTFPSFVTDLWNKGSTNAIDGDGRVILYGTNGGDSLGEVTIQNLSIVDPMLRYYIESGKKGLTLVGGNGDDHLAGTAGDDVLIGGTGADYLDSGSGLDQLIGGTGNDVLVGDAGSSVLIGGDGEDTYHVSSAYHQTIIDSDGKGKIIFNGSVLNTAARPDGGWFNYRDTNGNTYLMHGGDLVVENVLRITNFKNGDFGIFLDSRIEELGSLVDENKQMADWLLEQIAVLQGKAHQSLPATDESDYLTGGKGSGTFEGGRGDDVIWSGEFGDSYIYNLGDGSDWVYDLGSIDDSENEIRFGGGVSPDSVSFSYEDSNLIVRVGGQEAITFVDAAMHSDYAATKIVFSNGAFWDSKTIGAKLAQLPPPVVVLDGAGGKIINSGIESESFEGTGGVDKFYFFAGGGNDILAEFGTSNGGVDKIVLGSGINADDVVVTRQGLDIKIAVVDSSDSITIKEWGGVEKLFVQFADNSFWDVQTLMKKVSEIPFEGSIVNDILLGDQKENIMHGGLGDDELSGAAGSDIYLFARGDGMDQITDYDIGSRGIDIIRFSPDVDVQSVVLEREGDDLVIAYGGSNDRITIKSWNFDSDYHVERLEFADGTIWDDAALATKVAALTIAGTVGDDILIGDERANVFNGKAGDDELGGGTGSDVYIFGRGDGRDVIYDVGYSSDDVDTIRFAAGITTAEVALALDGGNLVLAIAGTGDSITIANWSNNSYSRIERLEFADGTVWNTNSITASLIGLNDMPAIAA